MQTNVLLIAETIDNCFLQSSQNLFLAARLISSLIPGKALMVIPGKNVQNLAEKITIKENIDTIALEHDNFLYSNPLLLYKALIPIIEKHLPSYIIFPHNMRSCLVAGKLAHHLFVLCISAVESFYKENSDFLIFRRSILNGKLTAEIKQKNNNTTIITVLPLISNAVLPEKVLQKSTNVTIEKVKEDEISFVPLNIIKTHNIDNTLEKADVIVSAGKGIGKKENLQLIYETSKIFNHCAIGASRVVCDMGWMPYSRQIGETGKKVAPKLYLACGISGSFQHVAGIKDSNMLVAINIDHQAAIFNFANYGVIEDLTTFLSLLIKKYKQ